jgi:hypothetical protein
MYIDLLIDRTLHTWLFHRIFFAPFPYFLRWLKSLNHNIWLCVDNRNLQGFRHKLNMELDLKSLFRLHVHSCIHWLRPRNPPPPHLGSYTRALLVCQDGLHTFPCDPLVLGNYICRLYQGFHINKF